MKSIMKLGFLAAIMVALVLASGTSAMAVHSDNLCSKCHSMHATDGLDGLPMTDDGNPKLLVTGAGSTTDFCLSCHTVNANIGGQFPPDVSTAGIDSPAGDFADSIATPGKGHNPVGGGLIFNVADVALGSTPPGDATALWDWACVSCHSPHPGATGNDAAFGYRLLRKQLKGPVTAGTYVDVSTTLVPVPEPATGIATSGDNVPADVVGKHNLYRMTAGDGATGFGAWCQGCHTADFHKGGTVVSADDSGAAWSDGTNWFRHPTATLLDELDTNNYGATAYDPLVPVELTATENTITTSTEVLLDSGANAQVFCLSCHKAHASAFPNAVRWDGTDAAGAATECNKCHAKGGA